MINFHTITLEAQELYDAETGMPYSVTFHNPVEMLFSKVRNIEFSEGDSADVLLTDGSRYLIILENEKWSSSQLVSRDEEEGDPSRVELVSLYGPYDLLEDALTDLVSKRNYLSSVN